MTSHLIGRDRIALHLEAAEFEKFGIKTRPAKAEEVKTLVFMSLARSGLPAEGDMEIEIYDGENEIMVFAHVGRILNYKIFRFDQLEDLIVAVDGLSVIPDSSSLFYYREAYHLEICGLDGEFDTAVMQLMEFGEDIRICPAYIREYGEIIVEGEAVGRLKKELLKK